MLLNRLKGLKKMMTGVEPAAPIAQLLGIEIIEVGTVKLLGHSPFIKAESTFMLHSSVDNNINQDRA